TVLWMICSRPRSSGCNRIGARAARALRPRPAPALPRRRPRGSDSKSKRSLAAASGCATFSLPLPALGAGGGWRCCNDELVRRRAPFRPSRKAGWRGAVRIVRLRCLSCGSRSEVTLGDLETRELRTQRYIHRNCRTCRGVTRHDVVGSDGVQVHTSTGFRDEPDDDAPKPRALVIEDDPDARAILGKALAAAHFEVVSVGDGREALKILVREDFTVILSDICMPELDGRQLFD